MVAVGASAGGLEAFTDLLRHLPADTGLAFVLIQHLAPGHHSMLAQLLSRETAMPVNEVEDGTVLAPNQVYVIPPNAAMTISGLALALKPREAAGTAIDAFLRSLAASRKSAAFAVILSGTGSDGALGVQAIAEEGGVVFAQDPASAKFDGMPRSAIATGCVDFVLPPEGIAAEVARIAREPRVIQREIPEASGQCSDSQKDFEAVLDLVRAATGIDFSMYRQTTVRRRLLRRLALLSLRSLRDYLEHVKENPDELHALTQDVLIRVTHFFRDPEAFEVLSRRVFPALIRKTPADRSVRIWVPGCSTGEEAYSIAICFLEAAEHMRSRVPLQVFATDINEAAIEKARRGMYIENISADVSPERLARFFVREGKDYHVSRKLRDLCIFSRTRPAERPSVLANGPGQLPERADLPGFHAGPGNIEVPFRSQSRRLSVVGEVGDGCSFPRLVLSLGQGSTDLHKAGVRQASGARAFTRKLTLPARCGRCRHCGPVHTMDLRRQADRVMMHRYGPPRVIVNANLDALADSGENAAFCGPLPARGTRKSWRCLSAGGRCVDKSDPDGRQNRAVGQNRAR